MHLCATLLPDRTVLVNGGAMMEETAAQAAFGAEIYHPGTGEWRMAADSRVPRLYHSVAVLLPDGKGRHRPGRTRSARPRRCASRSSGRRTCSRGPGRR
jgi:hypothetical protein